MVVLAAVQRCDEAGQPDRVDLVDATRAGIVTLLRRVAGHGEHVAHPFGVGAEQQRFEARHRGVAGRQVRNRLHPGRPLDRDRRHDPAHSRAGPRVVVHVHELRLARLLQRSRRLDQALVRGAERRIELHRDYELPLAEQARELRLLGRGASGGGQLLLAHDQRPRGCSVLVDRRADRRDLGGRRAAAAADQAGAEAPRLGGELREVVRRRVREDKPRAGEARETDVRHRCEHPAVALHRGQRPQRGGGAGAVIRADRGDSEPLEALRGCGGGNAAERAPVGVEGHQRHDRQARDGAHGRDRRHQLLEVVERLQHDHVGSAPLEDRRLLGVEPVVLLRIETLVLAERADRGCDEDIAARYLARLARQSHRGRIDPLELVLQEVRGELAPVGAERVRFDHVRTGADEARMERYDALRRAQIRLLRAAQPRHGARDQRPHAAVGDERGAVPQALGEPVCHGPTVVKRRRQPRTSDASTENG